MISSASLYTQALQRGGSLIPEMRTLLRQWVPAESMLDFSRRVNEADALGRATRRTAVDYLSAFQRRLVSPPDRPADALHVIASGPAGTHRTFADLLFFYTARTERLLWDFVVDKYWPAIAHGAHQLGADEVLRLIEDAESDGRIPVPWSATVHRDLPARVLNAATHFGLFNSTPRGPRPITPFRVTDDALAFLAYAARARGLGDAQVVALDAWRLFGLDRDAVLERLAGLHETGWLDVQRAGEVVRIDWAIDSMQEVTHRVAGC
jgi:hypothetical protein